MSQPPTPPRPRPVRQLAANLALLAATVALLLGVFELTLRLTGFSYVLYPEDIEFGMPDPVALRVGFREDPDLFWVTPDYAEELADLRRRRPPLLILGDSCSHLGRYDRALDQRVRRRTGEPLAYGNLAVAGWSSYQGLRQLQRDVPALGPKVVTIYFGWNDHWIGFGIEDKNVARVKRVFSSRLGDLRLAQLATKTLVALAARDTGYPNRVSLADFAANLEAMVAEARRQGAVPVLLTAPSNHRRGEEPAGLANRWLRDLSDLVPLHQSYVRAVREVARDTDAPLCDLERRFAALDAAVRDRSFAADGIHLSVEGDRRLAAMLDQCFERDGLWPLVLGAGQGAPASGPA